MFQGMRRGVETEDYRRLPRRFALVATLATSGAEDHRGGGRKVIGGEGTSSPETGRPT